MAIAGKQGEFFDSLETMTAEQRRRYANRKLRQTIEHAYNNAPGAKAIFDRAGVSPDRIRTVKDLELLPVTRKTELIELQKKSPPYGGLVTIPLADINRVFISPGPIYEPHQTENIPWFAKSFWAAGFRKGDVVINTFTYHMSPAGILFHEGIRHCGATAIPMGTGGTDTQIQTMLDLRVTGFVGTPTFLMTIIKRVEEMGYQFTRDFAVRRAWFTGERLPPSLRQTFEKDYHIATAQAYAVTEPGGAIAYECNQQSGMHFMDEYIVELVDPETGKQLGPNEIGEIVVTPIHNKTWGLIRFGTGDLSSYTTDACPCGRTAPRLMAIVGRTGDAVKVRGMFVVARQAEQALMIFDAVSRCQLVVNRHGQRDEIVLSAELKDDTADKDRLAREINDRFQAMCRLKLDSIEFVPPGAIPEKHEVILDKRTWE